MCIVVSCLVCIVVVVCIVIVMCIVVVVCIVVVGLCVLLLVVLCVRIAVFTFDAGLLARSQHSEGPATGHLDTGFSWFPCA